MADRAVLCIVIGVLAICAFYREPSRRVRRRRALARILQFTKGGR